MEQLCLRKNNIAIVGAGPAGVYCALNILKEFEKLKFDNFKIFIFDKSQVLRTILPTGNGRCNITNSIVDIKEFCSNYPRGEKFLYSIFSRYFNYDAVDFFDSIGVKTYTQDDGRLFPVSNSAKDVRDKMLNCLKTFKNVQIINKNINSIGELKNFNKIILSTGSKGSLNLIKSTGHNCVEFKKALCALNIEDNIYPKGVSVKSLDGDFIFTSTGISGPLAFKISSINAYKNFPYEIEINLFSPDELLEEIKNNSKKNIGNIVSKFIPKSLASVLVQEFEKKAAEVSKEKLKTYSKLKLKITSTSKEGEIVHAGGVELSEVDKNVKSKIKDNLWFCGEILNIDGFCGGFNLQNCWSTAAIVAKDVVSSIINK